MNIKTIKLFKMQFPFVFLAKSQRLKVYPLFCAPISFVSCFRKSSLIAVFISWFAALRFCVIISFSVFILQSCSSGNDAEKIISDTKDAIPFSEKFHTGEIINKVVCKNDIKQSYALYLPSNYSVEKKYPVIYAFDPHAAGELPVTQYKDLAEKYGYIIIGSNNSKNGTSWEESQSIAEKLFADAGNRLSINTDRIYLLGFSGGARVANTLAITNGSIAGVICCGAAAPLANSNHSRNNYSFLGIVGNEDFNYVEMKKYDMVDIAGYNIKHVLITFDGKHEWPANEVMDEAFWWLALNEMRKNNSAKNDVLISQHLQPELKKIEMFKQKNRVVDAYNLCQKTINFYDGLADLSSCFAYYKSMQDNPEIDNHLKQEEVIWTEEEELKKVYMRAFQTEKFAWWIKNITTVNHKIKTEKDKNKIRMYKRVLGFLSLMAYMQTSGALQQNNLPAAAFFCEIYILVDPQNNEAHYLKAVVLSKKGNNIEAIKSLNLAIVNGYTDIERLENEPAFNEIKNTKEFAGMIKNIK